MMIEINLKKKINEAKYFLKTVHILYICSKKRLKSCLLKYTLMIAINKN